MAHDHARPGENHVINQSLGSCFSHAYSPTCSTHLGIWVVRCEDTLVSCGSTSRIAMQR